MKLITNIALRIKVMVPSRHFAPVGGTSYTDSLINLVNIEELKVVWAVLLEFISG